MHHFDGDSRCGNMCSTPPLSNRNRRKRTYKPPKSLLHHPVRNTREVEEIKCVSCFFSASGAYSRLIVWFQFERSIGFFLIQTYIPAYLIVMLSWIAFWISHNSTPGQCNSSRKKAYTVLFCSVLIIPTLYISILCVYSFLSSLLFILK